MRFSPLFQYNFRMEVPKFGKDRLLDLVAIRTALAKRSRIDLGCDRQICAAKKRARKAGASEAEIDKMQQAGIGILASVFEQASRYSRPVARHSFRRG